MRKISPWSAVAAVVASLALVGGASFALSPAASVVTNPTQQEALDANQTVHNYILAHPDVTASPTPSATATATPTVTPTADGTLPSNFSATAGDQNIVLAWATPLSGTPTGYIYGRNGVDNTGYGAYTSGVLPTTTHTVTLDKLLNGTAYTVFVQAVYASGNKQVSATVTPHATVTPSATATPTASATATPTATPTTPPGGNPSGMAWSSGVWTDQDPAAAANFVSAVRGGRALDNILVYTTRSSIATENAPLAWKAALPADFNGVSQDIVLGLTTWTADGAFMTQAQGQTIGASLCSVDATRPIVRLDWEMNLNDGAGSNGAALTSANYTAWVARFNAVATGLKAGCPGLRVDFNPNQGADQTSGCNSGTYAQPNNCSRRAFQAVKANVDIFGVDTYDSWPPVTASGSGWNSHLTAFNRLDESRTYALANGKKWSVPEWGVACNGSGCQWQGNAGGDDPEYVKRYIAYFKAHAADVAYETYFDDPNSYIVSDLINNNPSSRAQYAASMTLAS